MTYQTAAAFRRALETRLVAESAQTGTPLVRLRKLVVFERFLAASRKPIRMIGC